MCWCFICVSMLGLYMYVGRGVLLVGHRGGQAMLRACTGDSHACIYMCVCVCVFNGIYMIYVFGEGPCL